MKQMKNTAKSIDIPMLFAVLENKNERT